MPPPLRRFSRSSNQEKPRSELISDHFWWITLICLAVIGFLWLWLMFMLLPMGEGGGAGRSPGNSSGDGFNAGIGDALFESSNAQANTQKSGKAAAPRSDQPEEKPSTETDSANTPPSHPESSESVPVSADEVNNPSASDPTASTPTSGVHEDGPQPKKQTIDFDDVEEKKTTTRAENEAVPPKGREIGLFSEPEAGFFGINVRAEKVAFVVDASTSMSMLLPESGSMKFQRTKLELLKSLRQLSPKQRFSVVLFNDQPIFDRDFQMVSPTANRIRDLENSLNNIFPFGGTDPSGAMQSVLQSDHDAIFLLSDGEFDPNMIDWIRNANSGHKMICTICLGEEAVTLQQIAKDSGGKYLSVK